METKINWGRVLYLCIALFCGICLFIWGGPFIHNNKELSNIIIVTFSILAGFVLLLVYKVSDSILSLAQNRSWRFTQLLKIYFANFLIRESSLVGLYISTIFLIFIYILFGEESSLWLERTWLSFAGMAMIISIHLPFAIAKIQMEKYELLLKEQRKEAKISD